MQQNLEQILLLVCINQDALIMPYEKLKSRQSSMVDNRGSEASMSDVNKRSEVGELR